jgi:hypothetical protein
MNARSDQFLITTGEDDILRNARLIVRYHLRELGGTVVGSVTGRENLVCRAASKKCELIILFGQRLFSGNDRADLPLENSVCSIQQAKARAEPTGTDSGVVDHTWKDPMVGPRCRGCRSRHTPPI